MCVHINGCDIESPETGRIRINYQAAATDGNTVADVVTLDFASSAQTVNATIIAAAKAKHSAQIGTVFGANDKVVLLGGMV